ncbi:MAG TPA: energy transducer TonB [Edaphobacter sp.]
MFEDSLVESQITQRSATKRWTMLGSTFLQAGIALTLITLPLLHPERLSFHVDTRLVFTPPPPRPPIRIVETQQAAGGSASTPSIPTMGPITAITHTYTAANDAPPVVGTPNFWSNTGDGITTALMGSGTGSPAVSVARSEPPKRIAVSTGVSAGLLLSPIRPVYPAIARAAGISGTVVVEAVISSAGTVESLKVISGPELLRAAALDALRAARYRPYLLNGQPTEVQTTYTVNFKLGA